MELFNNLSAILGDNLTVTIVIKKNGKDKMTVCANFSTEKGSVSEELTPFVLKGTPEELDKGFIEAIKTPVETVTGLVSNIEAFKESAKKAEEAAKSKAASTKSTSSTDSDLHKVLAKKEEERKQKEKLFKEALSLADKAYEEGKYHTAEMMYNLAAESTTDKKIKADIAKKTKGLTDLQNGFLCNDTTESAEETVKAFKEKFKTAAAEDTPKADEAEKTSDPDTDTETDDDNDNDEDADDIPENND